MSARDEQTGETEQSIQHRCPRMNKHHHPRNEEIPCGECYSLRVTSERVPWEPSQPWRVVTPPGAPTQDGPR